MSDAHRADARAAARDDLVCEHCEYVLHSEHGDAICPECGLRTSGRLRVRLTGLGWGIVAATCTVAALGWSSQLLVWTRRPSDEDILALIVISAFTFLVGFILGLIAVCGHSIVGRVLGGATMLVNGWVIVRLAGWFHSMV